MKKYFVLGLTGLLFACGGAEDTVNENEESDSLATTEAEVEEVVEEAVLIEGEDKGDYTLYGYESIDAEGTEIDSPTMLAEVEANGSFEGKVKVEIEEVCQKAGCWITFNDGAEGSIRVFFKDHFTIPTETAAGTQAAGMPGHWDISRSKSSTARKAARNSSYRSLSSGSTIK